MEKTIEKKAQTVELDKLDVNNLPELKGWRQTQLKIVKENPFVAITDNKTYEDAKKARTTLVSARTTIEKQDKTVASKLTDFRKRVAQASGELIAITLPHEQKQQEEVKRYEAEKEAERAEKERIERERKEAIQNGIETAYQDCKATILQMAFGDIETVSDSIQKAIDDQSEIDMEEFDLDWAEKTNLLTSQLDERVRYLQEKEDQRLESERLAKEREALEAERRKAEAEQAEKSRKAQEAAKAEAAKLAKEREKFESEKRELELQAKEKEAKAQEAMRAEREKMEAEKAKIEKARAEHQAKLDAEIKAKQDAENKKREEAAKKEAAKKAEALKPDIEKLKAVIESLLFTIEEPKLKTEEAFKFLSAAKTEIAILKTNLLERISTIN